MTEMKHLILFLIFFSFSTSTVSSSLAPSSLDAEIFSFPKPEGDEAFSMLPMDVDPRLQQLCEGTEYPIKCLTTTISFLDDKAVVDPVSTVKEEVAAFYGKIKEALHKASRRLSNPSTSRFATYRLKSCIDDYRAILQNKHKIFDAISVGDTKKLIQDLNSNVDSIYACEDEFKEANSKTPIMAMDSLLGRMISNSLSIGVDTTPS